MQTSFSIRELARLTGWDRKKISEVFKTLGDEPTLEEIVAAFIAAKSPAEPAPAFYSQSELHRLTGLDRATIMDRLSTVASHPGPKNSKLYSLSDSLPALIAGRDVTLDEVKLKRESNRARREEIELQKLEKKLVDFNEARGEFQEIFKTLHRRLSINFWREYASRLFKADSVADLARIGQDGQQKIWDALRTNYKAITGSD